jgi:hypothetical protein
MLEIMATCNSKIWWKLQSCIMSAINDQIGSPHGSITNYHASNVSHCLFLFLVEGGLWVPSEGLGGQVKVEISPTIKVTGVDILYISNNVTPLSSSRRMTGSKGSSGLVRFNACIWSVGCGTTNLGISSKVTSFKQHCIETKQVMVKVWYVNGLVYDQMEYPPGLWNIIGHHATYSWVNMGYEGLIIP